MIFLEFYEQHSDDVGLIFNRASTSWILKLHVVWKDLLTNNPNANSWGILHTEFFRRKVGEIFSFLDLRSMVEEIEVSLKYLLFSDRDRIRGELLTSIRWRDLLNTPPTDSESICSRQYKDCSAGFEFLRHIQSVFLLKFYQMTLLERDCHEMH